MRSYNPKKIESASINDRMAHVIRNGIAYGALLALGALALTTALDHNPNPTKDYEGYVTAPYQQSIISFVFEEEGQPSKIVPYSSDDCKDFQEGIRYLDEAYKHHIKIAFRAKNGLQGMLELEGCIHPTLDDHVK